MRHFAWISLISLSAGLARAQPGASDSTPAPAQGEGASADGEEALSVTVVGTPLRQTAGSAHVLGAKQLERFEHDDPHAVMAAVPGVYSRGEDGIGLRPNLGIRGVNPDRSKKITLLEDGILVGPAPYSAPAAYYFPLVTRMSGLRIIKGPAALVYGPQTVGGAVDLVTRAIPSGPAGFLDLGLGEYGYTKLHAWHGSSDERTGYLIEGAHISADGFKELPDGSDTGFYRNEWMLKTVYVVDPNAEYPHEVRFKASYSDELSNETYLGLTDADFARNPLARYGPSRLDRMRWHRTSFALTYALQPQANLKITSTAYRHDLSRQWRKVNGFRGKDLFSVLTEPTTAENSVYYAVLNGGSDSSSPGETLLIGPNDRDYVSQGVESRFELSARTGPVTHQLEYGVRLHHDRIERRHSEDGFLVIGGRLIPEGSPTVTTAFNEASTDALALHVADKLAWGRLTLTPGVRVEWLRSAARDRITDEKSGRIVRAVLPGAGAHYALTDEVGVLAGAYRGFSPPAPGSPSFVEPELSRNYEAGGRYMTRKSRLELIGFYNDYDNLTDVCTFSSGCLSADLDRQFDAGRARIFGFEALADHTLSVGALGVPLSVAYTLTQTEFRNSFTSADPMFGDVAAGDELPYVPRHQLFASLGLETSRAGASVGATYVAAMRERAGSAPLGQVLSTDEQLVFDAAAKVRVASPVELYVTAKNVANSHFIVSRRPFGARPNAPRWVQAGAKVSF